MPHPCVVCGRSRMNPHNREEDYMFFGFPVNYDTRCRKWLEFCCREDLYKLTKKQLLQRMICSKHFASKDFLNEYCDRLNCTAVPSIYDPKQSLYNITCVLCGKSRKDPPDPDYDGTTFHHFPGEEFRCLKWLDFVGVDSYYRLTRKEILYCYICSHHFDKTQFLPGFKNRLADNAIPNIRNLAEDISLEEGMSLQILSETRPCNFDVKFKKMDPLPTAVLESQACAACGRSRSDPRNKIEKYKFHPFPAYEIGRCLRWCQFLGREDLLKMSPNQIRKLVLCSKHFLAGQTFQKVGPCDAVPTIKEISDSFPVSQQMIHGDLDDIEQLIYTETVSLSTKPEVRPLVSSKKPFVMNKPAPLAKKRGKQRRSTSINIPKPNPPIDEIRVLRKLPLPPASNNWKVQIPNQFQPITIANAITPIGSNLMTDGKKVILPFTGNISNLGSPIPVSSLSSIPPGLLIKINLPQQESKNNKCGRSPKKSKQSNYGTVSMPNLTHEEQQKIPRGHCRVNETSGNIETVVNNFKNQENQEEHLDRGDLSELLNFSGKIEEVKGDDIVIEGEQLEIEEGEMVSSYTLDDMVFEENQEEIIFDDRDHDLVQGIEIEVENDGDESTRIDTELAIVKKKKKKKRKKLSSSTCRRTILPIKCEVGYFLKKLKPLMRKLPKRAKAQLKLAIVNKVIDHL